MKLTKITQQQKQPGRYSLYIDGNYSFSLSEAALLESGLASGQTITEAQLADFKKLSDEDKLYNRVLRYVAMRPRSVWEVEFYLRRKDAAPALIKQMTDKLLALDLLDDTRFTRQFVHDRRLLRSASLRKIRLELQKKHIAADIIEAVLRQDDTDERAMLRAVVAKKRQQSKYQDDLKLMQYLARQGFSYGDIKDALNESKQ